MKSGLKHDRHFSQALAAPADGSRLQLHKEPDEPILLLGAIVRDIGVLQDMCSNIVFKAHDEYRRDLRVCKTAAESIARRCARLIGD